MVTTPAPVDSFRIDLPASWQQMPTDPDELRAIVAQQRDAEAWQALSTTDRRRLELYVERFIADLVSANAVIAALYTERADPDPTSDADDVVDDAEPGGEAAALLVASATVSIMHKSQLGSVLPLTADVVLSAMTLDRPAQGATTITNLEPPALVHLDVGAAVRVVRLLSQRLGLTDSLKLFTESYFIPVPEQFESLVVAQFATPNVADSRAFSELFGEIANTIRFYREDEPTTL